MAPRTLLLTTEPLPFPGQMTTGAGLRAWGLAEGLRSQGNEVTIATCAPDPSSLAQPPHVRFFDRQEIRALLDREKPDVLVLQHWGLVRYVPELTIPLAIDLAGPHVLERLFWGSSNTDDDVSEKIEALRRADFLTCSGEYQRHYFYPFLLMAGYDLRTFHLPVIPFSVPSEPAPSRNSGPGDDINFLYGGTFLAWQNPEPALRWALEEMEKAQRGKLHFYGGAHPVIDASAGKFAELEKWLSQHPRVEMHPFVPFDQLLQQYSRYDVAIDLMEQNPERVLAFTTRTMVYLHCGLPVIYNNYSELSSLIRERKCGWTLPPEDEVNYRTLIRSLLSSKDQVQEFSRNAVSVAADYSWNRSITPLAEFCKAPYLRSDKTVHALSIIAEHQQQRSMKAELEATRRELNILKGKLLFRLYQKAPTLGFIAAPLAYAAGLVISAVLWFQFRKSCISNRKS